MPEMLARGGDGGWQKFCKLYTAKQMVAFAVPYHGYGLCPSGITIVAMLWFYVLNLIVVKQQFG